MRRVEGICGGEDDRRRRTARSCSFLHSRRSLESSVGIDRERKAATCVGLCRVLMGESGARILRVEIGREERNVLNGAVLIALRVRTDTLALHHAKAELVDFDAHGRDLLIRLVELLGEHRGPLERLVQVRLHLSAVSGPSTL